MTETQKPQRAQLSSILDDTPPTPISAETLRKAAEASGFDAPKPRPAKVAAPVATKEKPRRKSAGSILVNVMTLRVSDRAQRAFYEVANDRDIPLGFVFEEAMEALMEKLGKPPLK
jgi:hypothetical protein